MKHLSVTQLNEYFENNAKFETINLGYGEEGAKFDEYEFEDLDDFHHNAEFGNCWTNENGTTFYKVRYYNEAIQDEEAVAFIINDGEIETV
jgi:hypothetical protein